MCQSQILLEGSQLLQTRYPMSTEVPQQTEDLTWHLLVLANGQIEVNGQIDDYYHRIHINCCVKPVLQE